MFKSEGATAKPGERILCFTSPRTSSEYAITAMLRVGRSDFCLGSAPGFNGFCLTRFPVASATQSLMLADLYLASSKLSKEQKVELELLHTIAADRDVTGSARACMSTEPVCNDMTENKSQ